MKAFFRERERERKEGSQGGREEQGEREREWIPKKSEYRKMARIVQRSPAALGK